MKWNNCHPRRLCRPGADVQIVLRGRSWGCDQPTAAAVPGKQCHARPRPLVAPGRSHTAWTHCLLTHQVWQSLLSGFTC